jgi:hypothetical protein
MTTQTPPPTTQPAAKGGWATFITIVKYIAAVVLFVLTVIVAIYGFGFDPFGWKKGELRVLPPVKTSSDVEPVPQITLVAETNKKEEELYEPPGQNCPTTVSFENNHRGDILIRQATFTWTKQFKTPHRETKTGALVSLPLNFYKSINPGSKTYSVTLNTPKSAAKDDYVAVKVAIIDKQLVGQSFRGTLKLNYNNNKVITVPNVVVDVLAATPKEDDYK